MIFEIATVFFVVYNVLYSKASSFYIYFKKFLE